MESPPEANAQSEKGKSPLVPRTPSTGPRTPVEWRLSTLPLSAGGATSDEAMWRRLREAGFDEEMITRRDKAALVAYITKLEAELREYQHHMGLLIIERKEWTSKYDEVKASAELADINQRRELMKHVSALADAQIQEENLKRALRVEKECVINLEKALHELRAESAEAKVAAEAKLGEANILMADAQKKLDEAESKMRIAESMHVEADLCHSSASRQLQEVKARDDELRRRLALLNSEQDAKGKEIQLLRESINNNQKALQKEREKLLEQQYSLNTREEHIFKRSQELDNFDNDLRARRENIDKDLAILKDKESSLSTNLAVLSVREQVTIEREAQLDKRERKLLLLQESLASKEKDEVDRLRMENESILEKLKSEMESEFARKTKFLEDRLNTKEKELEVKETYFIQQEKLLDEKEKKLEFQSKALTHKDEEIAKKLKLLSEKEEHLSSLKKIAANAMLDVEKEKSELKKKLIELEKERHLLQDERKQLEQAQERLEITTTERSDLSVLETKLKEEIDSFRAQKTELDAEIDRIKKEKDKFEAEWELIDKKNEELKREVELVEQQRISGTEYLKNERDSLKLEKDMLLDQIKRDYESLALEREEFIRRMDQDHSDWFGKIQRERDAFLEDIKIQKRELEISIEKRRTEIETYLREKVEEFENEKKKELAKMHACKEMIAKDLEKIELEHGRLNREREENARVREMRNIEWSEMKNYVNELELQREKLQKAREELQIERWEICEQTKKLKMLEKHNLPKHVVVDNSSNGKPSLNGSCVNERKTTDSSIEDIGYNKDSIATYAPMSFSWVKKCTDIIFRRSPDLYATSYRYVSPPSASEANQFGVTGVKAMVEDVQGLSDLNGAAGNGNKEVFKSVVVRQCVPKTIIKGASLCDGNSNENLQIDERLCKENAMVSGSSIHEKKHVRSPLSDDDDDDANAVPLTRKRLKDSSAVFEPNAPSDNLKKYQKRRRQDEISLQSLTEETVTNSLEASRPSVPSQMFGQDYGLDEFELVGTLVRGDDLSVASVDPDTTEASEHETRTLDMGRNFSCVRTEEFNDCMLNSKSRDLFGGVNVLDLPCPESQSGLLVKSANTGDAS